MIHVNEPGRVSKEKILRGRMITVCCLNSSLVFVLTSAMPLELDLTEGLQHSEPSDLTH